MPDFHKRSAAIEVMDDLTCSGEVVSQTLRELEKINFLLGGNYVTVDGIAELVKTKPRMLYRIADLGCGSGDMIRLISKWAARNDMQVHLTGIDANPFIINYARTHTDTTLNIEYNVSDIFSEQFGRRNFDIVVGTLFFHHFSDEQLIYFFRDLKQKVGTGIIINDIHRHPLAYYSIKFLTKLFSKSSMVINDAPLSVLRAFKKKELESIMLKAGITNYTIRWMWAFRWQVIIKTS